jgi:Putative peptidoglycan binding domain
MADRIFQGKAVSDEWDLILTDAAKRVTFRLNSGRRTLREQSILFAQNMIAPGRPKPGRPMTAVPNPRAPHIMVGRPTHSLDIDTKVGDGEQALERELERMGLIIINDVAGEPWHQTERDASRLRRVAGRIEAQIRDPTPTLTKGMAPDRKAVTRLQRLLRGAGVTGVPLNGRYDLATRVAVKRFQRKHLIPTDPRATVGDKTWALLEKINR